MPSLIPSTLKVVCNFCKQKLSYGTLPGHYRRFGHGPFNGTEGTDWIRESDNHYEYQINKIKQIDLTTQQVIYIEKEGSIHFRYELIFATHLRIRYEYSLRT